MAEEDKKSDRKPFKGAQVLFPFDMPDDMLEDAVLTSKRVMDEHEFDSAGVEIAKKVKEYFDQKYDPTWHVFLGKQFGCHTIHEKNRFVYFTFDHNNISFLIYKAK